MAAPSPLSLLPGRLNNEGTWGRAPQDLRVGLAWVGLSPPSQHSHSPSPIRVQKGWRPRSGQGRWADTQHSGGSHTARGGLYPSSAASSAAAPDLRILHPRPRPRAPQSGRRETSLGGSPQGAAEVHGGRRAWPRPSGVASSRPPPLRVRTVGRRAEEGAWSPFVRAPSAPLSRHPRRQRFVPHPAQPLPGLVQRRGGGTPLCEAVRT